MADSYYCAICDIELDEEELQDNGCPYCGTEIPEAAEGEQDIKRAVLVFRPRRIDVEVQPEKEDP